MAWEGGEEGREGQGGKGRGGEERKIEGTGGRKKRGDFIMFVRCKTIAAFIPMNECVWIYFLLLGSTFTAEQNKESVIIHYVQNSETFYLTVV